MSMGTAVVTGAGRGIGRAIAHRLAKDGYPLLLVDRDAETVAQVGRELGAPVAALDITDESAVLELAGRVPDCSVLVNNAAITLYSSLLETSAADARLVLDVNVVSMLSMTRALAPLMTAGGGGAIVNLSSITARAHPPQTGIYSASKAAVEQLTRALAVELGPLGIRCNSVAPGAILTEGSAEHYGGEERQRRRGEVLPLGRLGASEEIADAVSWLVSAGAAYITGQIISVDGGFAASAGQHFRLARGDR